MKAINGLQHFLCKYSTNINKILNNEAKAKKNIMATKINTNTIGKELASKCDWNAKLICESFLEALTDSNYHTFKKQMEKEIERLFVIDNLNNEELAQKIVTSKYYISTSDFVYSNNLGSMANNFFGEDWESEDDVEQIQTLLDSLFGERTFLVQCIEGLESYYDIQVIKLR